MPLLSGKILAEGILAELKEKVTRASIKPGLAAILVGDYLESHKYVGLKEERAKEIGIHFEKQLLPRNISEEKVLETIQVLNSREDIHGIIVQLPLPDHLPTDKIIAAIDPKKDVDGFHQETLKKFLAGDQGMCPVFPRAIIELIRSTGTYLHGKRGVAVVNSSLLGEILSKALILEGLAANYVLSSAGKEVIIQQTREAQVIVTACGIPDLITVDMVSSDAIVIDGGNVHIDGKVRGDVDREAVLERVAWLSPVPGGVGPLTIAFLLKRTVEFSLDSKEEGISCHADTISQ